MDTFLIITGILLLPAGLAGCVLPALPGPPLSYIALLLLHFTGKYQFPNKFLIIWLIITAVVVILDYLVPVWGAKKFGASKRGIWGSIIGMLLGLFIFPPIGIIGGTFLGAVIGELTSGKETGMAIKAGFGSFAGFMTGMLLKLGASGVMTWYFFKELI
jgi:uncharacterized protein YqgC (DUF456 family)